MSLVDPKGEHKQFTTGFKSRSRSRLYHNIVLPIDITWADGVVSGVSITDGSIVQTVSGSTGTFTSSQLLFLDFTDEMKRDIDYVKFTITKTGSGQRYFVSNDGGENFPVEVLVEQALYKLPTSEDELNNFQKKFNDLRVRILLEGSSSPVVSSLKIEYSLK